MDSENLYLEEIYGDKAMAWVHRHNDATMPVFEKDPKYLEIKTTTKRILDDPSKIVQVTYGGDWAYNFWQDAKNIRGLWRRLKISDYLKGQRNWEVLLDFDQLAKKENRNWIFAGVERYSGRALVSLSDGGKDAKFIREFDMDTKSFVKGGFQLPEGKNQISWMTSDEVFLELAMTPEQTTDSGYAREVRVWKRGQSLESAQVIYSGLKEDVSVSAYVTRDEDDGPPRYRWIYRAIDFFNSEMMIYRGDGTLVKLDLPVDSQLDQDGEEIYLDLKSNWTYQGQTFKVGSLIRLNLEDYLRGRAKVHTIFMPTQTQFLQQHLVHRGRVFLVISDDVSSVVVEAHPHEPVWRQEKISLPEKSAIEIFGYSKKYNLITFSSEGFLQPETIFDLNLSNNQTKVIDQAPKYFDAEKYQVQQFFVHSKDGTRVPYFVVHKKGLIMNGRNPTVITAYGGFEVNSTPTYEAISEQTWMKFGGVIVLANIRGGGEYGPEWHTSAIKENRQKVYDDFFAVSQDLISRKITSPEFLGAFGRSNGGLLMGVALTQRPDLFRAICIEVPLFDMLRYHKLLAGASWVSEYGDPDDPNERKFLEGYSPYQNLKAGIKYPKPFFMTSTADDRVHPGHARRGAAKMEALGLPFYYYENTEGGHAGSANNEQVAKWRALEFTYFWQQLGSTPSDTAL